VIAVPLSRVNSRQGRFAQLLPGVIIYIIYIDLLFVSRSWVEHGILSPVLGLWWVHGLMLTLGCGLFFQYAGYFRQLRMRWVR